MKRTCKSKARTNNFYSDRPSLPAQARQHAAVVVEELVRIIQTTKSDSARLAAISTLLDRGFGKPSPSLDIATKQTVEPEPFVSDEEAAAQYAAIRKQLHENH